MRLRKRMIPFHFGGQKWIAYGARVSLRRTAIFFSNGINLRNFFFHRTCMLSGVYLKYFPVRKFCSKFIWILALYENFNSETRQLESFTWSWIETFYLNLTSPFQLLGRYIRLKLAKRTDWPMRISFNALTFRATNERDKCIQMYLCFHFPHLKILARLSQNWMWLSRNEINSSFDVHVF